MCRTNEEKNNYNALLCKSFFKSFYPSHITETRPITDGSPSSPCIISPEITKLRSSYKMTAC